MVFSFQLRYLCVYGICCQAVSGMQILRKPYNGAIFSLPDSDFDFTLIFLCFIENHAKGVSMQIEQVSVFLENKSGRLSEVVSIIAEAGVAIKAMNVMDIREYGVLRMIVSDPQKAKTYLKNHGIAVKTDAVTAIDADDNPGDFDRILGVLNQAGINLSYLYAYATANSDRAALIFKCDDCIEAEKALRENNIALECQNLFDA